MANGGTIPSNRTQTVSFYNTTGLVEKDKNIYYVPRLSKLGISGRHILKNVYLDAFNSVCPPSSSYANINISQWSPEDRTLVVRGNIDDFRVVTDEGACLNYFIVTRVIEKTNGDTTTTQTFYYAFFITKVEQAGGGSIRITAEPDDFTNVFYLHSTKLIQQNEINNDYTPFNDRLCNTYVARQHYNRVRVSSIKNFYDAVINTTSSFFVEGNYYRFYDMTTLTYYGDFLCEKVTVDSTTTVKFSITNKTVVPTGTYDIVDRVTSQRLTSVSLMNWTFKNRVDTYIPDNMKIFMNQEQTFKFKYQYRDDKYPISPYDGPFTEEEKELIRTANSLDDLSTDLKFKVITTCINYLVVETKSPEICYTYVTNSSHTQKLNVGELIEKRINRPNPVICYPFVNSPDIFKKFNLESYSTVIVEATEGGVTGGLAIDIDNVISRLNKNAVADYINSAYIINNANISSSLITITKVNEYHRIVFTVGLPDTHQYAQDSDITIKDYGYYVAGIKHAIDGTGSDDIIAITRDAMTNITRIYFSNGGILVSAIDSLNYDITLPVLGNIPNNLTNTYYDPVLESEPYSFYSISTYGNYELVFNKNRWYETGEVILNHYYSINGAVKESFIPRYTVESKQTLYFNEGLTFTLASSLPLVSDSYSSYYNQNKAQMKNQFAVAEHNYLYDVLQSIPSGMASVSSSFLTRGFGAASGSFIKEATNSGQMIVDYQQQRESIEMTQKAKLADVGSAPDTLKQAGSDVIYDLKTGENFLFLNHYTIDEISYRSIARMLERVGYQVNLYDQINAINRVGWNYVQLISFDWNTSYDIMTSQEDKIKQIFTEGVTLVHDKSYLSQSHNVYSKHNYEKILEGGE